MGKKGLDLNNLQKKWTKVDNTVLVHGNTAHLFSSCSALRLDSKGRRLVKDVDLLGSAATQGLVNRWTYETHTHTYTSTHTHIQIYIYIYIYIHIHIHRYITLFVQPKI